MDSRTDEKLVALACAGDRQAFDELVARYQAVAIRAARRMVVDEETARDLAQEALLRAYLSLAHLREGGQFRSWLCGIVRNVCRSYVRDQKAEWLSLETLSGGLQLDAACGLAASLDPQQEAERREQRETLREVLESLPPLDREVAWLFYEEQRDLKEIAGATGLSAAAVKNRLYRVRNRLRERLPEMDPAWEEKRTMTRVTVSGVFEEPRPAVVLVDETGQRALRIAMGAADAEAINLALRQPPLPRPMTARFMADLLAASGAKLEEVRIEKLEHGVFYAVTKLRRGKTLREIDARPSDALALAVQAGCPIYVAESIMGQIGFDFPNYLEKAKEFAPDDAPIPEVLPVLPMRDGVYFPGAIAPIFAGRDKTLRALEAAEAGDRYLLALAQRDASADDPRPDDMYRFGTVVRLTQIVPLPDGSSRILIEAKSRARVCDYLQTEPFHQARVELVPEAEASAEEHHDLVQEFTDRYERLLAKGQPFAPGPPASAIKVYGPGRLADTIAPCLSLSMAAKQELLETVDPVQRLEKLNALLE